MIIICVYKFQIFMFLTIFAYVVKKLYCVPNFILNIIILILIHPFPLLRTICL